MNRYFEALLTDVSEIKAIVYIDGFGNIQKYDHNFSTIFGYSALGLVGQNIKVIMPSPFNEYHDIYLERYRKTGKSTIIGSEGRIGRKLLGLLL